MFKFNPPHPLLFALLVSTSLTLSACGGVDSETTSNTENSGSETDSTTTPSTKQTLGQSLFSDTSLSLNRTQSCATCHALNHASIDSRADAINSSVRAMVSLGDDGSSRGDRNAPTVTYASLSPTFSFTNGRATGGQFWDGREADLQGQAGGPFLNPVEMNMPDKASVVARVQENTSYVTQFKSLYGDTIFDDAAAAYDALTDAISSFEKTDTFSTFDSRMDRLQPTGLSTKERNGMHLFFSRAENLNCIVCHDAPGGPNGSQQAFTNFEYKNVGTPKNNDVRTANAVADTVIDNGLFENSAVNGDDNQKGKFKTATLRNVAVTGPYMHNGVFKDLKTVVEFYQHHIPGSSFTTNPETESAWQAPEQPLNLDRALTDSKTLTTAQVDELTCFLRALTDERFEALIEENGLVCSD